MVCFKTITGNGSRASMHRSHTISLPQRLVLPLRGAPLPNALILCDCDDDGDVELCVGTTDGYVQWRFT